MFFGVGRCGGSQWGGRGGAGGAGRRPVRTVYVLVLLPTRFVSFGWFLFLRTIRRVRFALIRWFRGRFSGRHVLPDGPYANGIDKIVLIRELIRRSHANVHVRRRFSAGLCLLVVLTNRYLRRSAREPCRVVAGIQASSAFANFAFGGMEITTAPRGTTYVLVSEVICIRVARVERDGGTKCVNVIRWRVVTRSVCFGYVSYPGLEVVMDNVFLRNYLRFNYRVNTFFNRKYFLICFHRGFDDLSREESDRGIKESRMLGHDNVIQ